MKICRMPDPVYLNGMSQSGFKHPAETESVVEFPAGQQSGIGGDPRTMELKLHAAVEIEPERPVG